MRFSRNVFRAASISSDVEQEATLFGLEITTLRSRRRMQNRALALVCQERVCDGVTKRAVVFTPLGARDVAIREVRGFELVILRCSSIQLVDRWRLVVHRRRVDADDAAFGVDLISR